MSMKNSNDTIGKRTRDLPACRAVPQRTAPLSVRVTSIKCPENEYRCLLFQLSENSRVPLKVTVQQINKCDSHCTIKLSEIKGMMVYCILNCLYTVSLLSCPRTPRLFGISNIYPPGTPSGNCRVKGHDKWDTLYN